MAGSFYFYAMEKKDPIGIFDSGVGGITIWKEVANQLPKENTIYLADNKNAPYGFKSPSEILAYSIKNTEFLLSLGVKLIVIACNTATTNAIYSLRRKYPNIGFIGVEPAIKPAAIQSISKRIAVLATYTTLHSKEFLQAANEPYIDGVALTQIVGTGLVPLIEANELESSEMQQLIQKYTQEMIAADIDRLVLGCTHYPYIRKQLKEALPKKVKIIDSGEAVARQTKFILQSNNILNEQKETGKHKFYYNKPSKTIKNFVPKNDHSELLFLDF